MAKIESGSPPYLDPIPFSSGRLLSDETFPLIVGFTCNKAGHPETQFKLDVTEWLTASHKGGALEAVRLGLAEVRLFLAADRRVIGYGAIGPVDWTFGETIVPLWLLHYFGVHTDFRSAKFADYRLSYGRRLLGGIIEEVVRRGDRKFIALYVDPQNPARGNPETNTGFYPEFGFREIDAEVERGRTWVRMLRPL